MSRDFRLYLEDMQESCLRILRYSKGYTYKQFIQDDQVYDAVLRNIEIIGEAAKNIPEEFRLEHTEIDWRRIAVCAILSFTTTLAFKMKSSGM